MQTSCRLIVLGVGVILALSGVKPGLSQTPTPPSQAQPQPNNSSPPATNTPAPTQTTPTSTPPPPNSQPTETPASQPAPQPATSSTSADSLNPDRAKPAPNYLNPSANPLQFPTQADEVRLRGVQPITLRQAIELAERNNRQLQISQLELERSRAALRQVQAELYPTVDLQSNLSRSQSAAGDISVQAQREAQRSLPESVRTEVSDNPVSNVATGSLSLNYDVFTSGLRPANIRAAERQVRFNELQVEVTREQLRLDVTGDYYNVQEADESVRINQAAVLNAQQSLRDAQAQERAGIGTRFDVLRAQVQLANFTQDLVNSRAQQQIRRRALAQRLSLAQTVDVTTADPVEVAGVWTLPLESTIVLAFKGRAELEQQLIQREISQQRRKAALASVRPTVSLSAAYNLQENLDDEVGLGDGYSIGAGLRWRLFDGGAARARANQEERNIEISETQFARVRDQARFEVEQAYANLQSNLENIQTTTVALEQAREALRLARLRFQAGVGTQTDVINAETDLTRSEGARITAILGYNRALAALQRAVSNISVSPTGGITAPTGTTPTTVPESATPTPTGAPTQPAHGGQ